MKHFAIIFFSLVLLGASCRQPVPTSELPPEIPAETAKALILLSAEGEELERLIKEHTVGSSPCPDVFPQLNLGLPPGFQSMGGPLRWTSEGAPKWLDVPESGTIGEPFEIRFNCNIDDLNPHEEEGGVNFRLEGELGKDYERVDAELDKTKETHNLPIDLKFIEVVTKVR
jgi:hypothetical protein